MKTLYVIGNGFDLHHGLETSYYSYKKFLMRENFDFVKRFDDFLERYVEPNELISRYDIEKWSALESYTKYIYDYDLNEILEEAMASSEQDMDRASYWNDIQYMCDDCSEWINGIRTSFVDWIRTIEYHPKIKDEYLVLEKSAKYLNFNYTYTLEQIYDVPSENVLHIHGDMDHDIIFGNNEEPEMVIEKNSLQINEYEDADWRINEASEILNSVINETKKYYKDTSSQILKNKRFFIEMSECEKLIFMGISFGNEDSDYIDEILKQTKSMKCVVLYYHDEETKERFEWMFMNRLDRIVEIQYVEW